MDGEAEAPAIEARLQDAIDIILEKSTSAMAAVDLKYPAPDDTREMSDR